jgi:hypothetical protein
MNLSAEKSDVVRPGNRFGILNPGMSIRKNVYEFQQESVNLQLISSRNFQHDGSHHTVHVEAVRWGVPNDDIFLSFLILLPSVGLARPKGAKLQLFVVVLY